MTQTATAVTTWQIDGSHSSAEFSVKHMMVAKVKGRLGAVQGTLSIDEQNPANSSVEATIDIAGINTNDVNRDNHLRSPDFFDVANHPVISFKSTKVEVAGTDSYQVTGDLTIRGATQQVVLDVSLEGRVLDAYGKDRTGFSATTTLNRKDFGLNWNMALEAGGWAVSDKVAVELNIEAVKADA